MLTLSFDHDLLTKSGEVFLFEYDAHAGGWSAPFPHHREEDGGGEEGEGEASVAHGHDYPTAGYLVARIGEGLNLPRPRFPIF